MATAAEALKQTKGWPRFDGRVDVISSSKTEHPSRLNPTAAGDRLDDFADGLDFGGTVDVLDRMGKIREKLVRRAAPAYAQDTLNGRTMNNPEGLIDALGYSPAPDAQIGFMVPVMGEAIQTTALLAPILEKGKKGERWIVPMPQTGMIRPKTEFKPGEVKQPRSLLMEHVSFSPSGGAGMILRPIEFDSHADAMAALQQELINNDYSILTQEPPSHTDLHLAPGSLATSATVER